MHVIYPVEKKEEDGDRYSSLISLHGSLSRRVCERARSSEEIFFRVFLIT